MTETRLDGAPAPTLIIGDGWLSRRPAGLNRFIADLTVSLRALDWPTSVLMIGPPDLADQSTASDITVSDEAASVPRRLLALRRAARTIPQRPGLVDAHFSLYALPIVVFGPLRRVPLVVHFHGPWSAESVETGSRLHWARVKRAIERAVYRRAERVIVLSEAFGRLVVDQFGVPADRVRVVPPGVDLTTFSPAGSVEPARRRLGLHPDDFVVVAVRRLERRMGLDTLLAAWSEVQRAIPHARLLVVGDGPMRAELESIASRLPRPDEVRFLGGVSEADVQDAYRVANCSAVPSRALEGFGLVVLESLACGTPAIVTDVGGLPSAVTGLDPSLVVKADRPDQLAARLIAAAHGTLPDRAACRAHAETFALDQLGRATIEIYQDVMRQRSPDTASTSR